MSDQDKKNIEAGEVTTQMASTPTITMDRDVFFARMFMLALAFVLGLILVTSAQSTPVARPVSPWAPPILNNDSGPYAPPTLALGQNLLPGLDQMAQGFVLVPGASPH